MTLQFNLQQSAELIFDYLTDMQKFVSVHPVITKIEQKKDEHYRIHETLKFKNKRFFAGVSIGNYRIHETLKMGFIPISFTYSATVEGNWAAKTVVIRATVMKMTKIEMSFVLKTEQDGTISVEETIDFKSPLPIKSMMQRIFKTQHELLFKNINAIQKTV